MPVSRLTRPAGPTKKHPAPERCDQRALTIDSSHFDLRRHSRHYEWRCRKIAAQERARLAKCRPKDCRGPEALSLKAKQLAHARRSQAVKRQPKLTLACLPESHPIVAARATIGGGSDAPHFFPLLRQVRRRLQHTHVVADAGYDSEQNHVLARGLGLRAIIPPEVGRQGKARGKYRRQMQTRLRRVQRGRCVKTGRRARQGADVPLYRLRSQSETVNHMLKANLSDYCTTLTDERRKGELYFKSIVHNVMILAEMAKIQGCAQNLPDPFSFL